MKTLFHTIHASLATLINALLTTVLLSVACVSCGDADGVDGMDGGADGASAESRPAAPSPDTLALVEGLRLFDTGQYSLAREQLTVSARSESSYIRAESFLYLNALEMELGNYREARTHLDRYHTETMRLLRSAAEDRSRSERQTARLVGRYEVLVGWIVLVMIAIVAVTLFLVRRRGAAWSAHGVQGARGMQVTRNEAHVAHGAAVQPVHGMRNDRAPRSASGGVPRYERVTSASILYPDGERVPVVLTPAEPTELTRLTPAERAAWLAEAEAFRQTEMWAEIAPLAAARPGRDARVLTTARQDALDAELSATFPAFTSYLRAACPPLTAGDVKLCCLSLAGLGAFGRAVCFGSTETNIIKQRKHTIKKKLATDARSRALFEFVFNVNRV